MERRDFLKSACLTCAGGIGAMWLLEACTPQKYITNFGYVDNKITLKKSEFTVVKKDKVVNRKFIVLKPENFQFPIAVYKLNEEDFQTSFLQCTHQGCELTPYESMMVCPCHGAEFNTKGEVTTGPAETNLKSFITTHDQENIYIQINS
jgi:cytochrome b6-f complex iron-sulfur subunit